MEDMSEKDPLNCIVLDFMLCSPANLKSIRQVLVRKKRLAWNEKPQMAVICGYFSRQIILFIVLTSKKKYRIFLINNLVFRFCLKYAMSGWQEKVFSHYSILVNYNALKVFEWKYENDLLTQRKTEMRTIIVRNYWTSTYDLFFRNLSH